MFTYNNFCHLLIGYLTSCLLSELVTIAPRKENCTQAVHLLLPEFSYCTPEHTDKQGQEYHCSLTGSIRRNVLPFRCPCVYILFSIKPTTVF